MDGVTNVGGLENRSSRGEGNQFGEEMVGEEERVAELEPKVGMGFEQLEEVYEFYKRYAKEKGFGISKRGSRRDVLTGELRWLTITCNKGREHKAKGNNILARRPSGREGCKARISCVKLEGVWIITKVKLGHNHEVSPKLSRYIRQHRVVDFQRKRQLEINEMAGLRPCQNVKSVVYKAGGHENFPCLSVDLTNHVSKVRRLQVVGGDAEALHNLFGKMQTESKDFVYLIKPDKEGRLKHVFWADGRCRAAYKDFNDVITFDTTYLVNKYEMPFACFVGVNQHGHSILFGCALLNNEKSKTFTWLFETWLSCMDGKHPEAIITDQCAQIGEAIKKVFPNTRHRWCLWHIMSKLPKKFAGNGEAEEIRDTIMCAVYDSMTRNEFEEKWGSMIRQYNLQSNEWLENLIANKQLWVPVYVKSSFWGGMSTTQRSESMNSYFDGYVHSRTTLTKFAEQYELAVREKVEKEIQEDFLSGNSQIPCITLLAFEKKLRNAYTSNIFRLVQKNLVDIMYCDVKLISADARNSMYEVTQIVSGGHETTTRLTFLINYECDTVEAKCNCMLFEFKGILCPHVFKVLTYNDVNVISERYILRRWRKDVARVHSSIKLGCTSMSSEMVRAKQLEDVFYTAMSYAVRDENKFDYLMGSLKENCERIEKWPNQSGIANKGKKELTQPGREGEGNSSVDERRADRQKYKDPVTVRRRGRPRTNRLVSNIERVRKKKNYVKKMVERKIGAGSSAFHSTSASALLQQATEGYLDLGRASSSVMGMCVGEMNNPVQDQQHYHTGMPSPPSVHFWAPIGNPMYCGVYGSIKVESSMHGIGAAHHGVYP